MKAFIYGIVLQFKLDIRNKNLLLTCYVIPIIFLLIMGQIFSIVNPDFRSTLTQTMVIMGVCMGSLIGVSATILETYNKDVKKCIFLIKFLYILVFLLLLYQVLFTWWLWVSLLYALAV